MLGKGLKGYGEDVMSTDAIMAPKLNTHAFFSKFAPREFPFVPSVRYMYCRLCTMVPKDGVYYFEDKNWACV